MKQNEKTNGKQMLISILFFGLCIMLAAETAIAAEVPEQAVANMPVKEVTVFKDGHVFVLHEGQTKTDTQGNVVLDYLPRPVLGTFWAYSANPKVKLSAVVSGKRIISLDRTALNIRELIEGNIGARVRIKQDDKEQQYDATIVGIPQRSSEELRRTSPPGTEDRLPERGEILLLKVAEGVKAVPIGQIEEVTFLDEPHSDVGRHEFRNIMTLKLDWQKRKIEESANVGMVYVQRGIRWIPSYRIDIDGDGNAVVKLQATLINELTDLKDVKANLVIGVPSFAFKDVVDPISLNDTVARLSRHFREDSRTALALSNSIMTQVESNWRENRSRRNSETINLGPEVTGSLKNEDLYVFTVEHITLKKGQRMVLPITEFKIKYSDVFILDLPFGPPPEVRHRFNNDQLSKLSRLLRGPKVMHKIRLENDSRYPLTTAPALVLRDGRIIAQGMLAYTPVGASVDLDLTIAVNIAVEKSDKEISFTPDDQKWDGHRYGRRNLSGTIKLTNRHGEKVYLEIKRSTLGHITSVDNDGIIEHLDRLEGGRMGSDGAPFWWDWHSWPHWWYYFNTVARVTWKFELEPGKSIDLEYKWHYFWRQ